MSDNDFYKKFLEESVTSNVVPTKHDNLQNDIRDWDGSGQIPTVSDDEDLTSIVDKILKKEPAEDGTEDVDRDEDAPKTSTFKESALVHRAKGKPMDTYDDGDLEENSDIGMDPVEECAGCDDKINELYEAMGISPLDLLEMLEEEDGDDDDDDDSEELPDADDSAEDALDDVKKKVSDSDESDKEIEEMFSDIDPEVLEQLISEMGVSDDELGEYDDVINEIMDELGEDDLLED